MLKELCEDRRSIENKNPEMVPISEFRSLQRQITDLQNLLLNKSEKSPIIQSRAAATPARSDFTQNNRLGVTPVSQNRATGCYTCGHMGHVNRFCPTFDQSRSLDSCYLCGDPAHRRIECKNVGVRASKNEESQRHSLTTQSSAK